MAAEVVPDQKVEAVENVQAQGYPVGVVDDGIDDALALATADVGIAFNSGPAVA